MTRFITHSMAIFLILINSSCDNNLSPEEHKQKRQSFSDLLSSKDISGYSRAITPRKMKFPEDYGPHPDFRNEWWYLTGNLTTDSGRHFGYQLTIFRLAMMPSANNDAQTEHQQGWHSSQLYMGHFALTDTQNNTHYDFEEINRTGAGLAGAEINPVNVWVNNWQLKSRDPEKLFPLSVTALATSSNNKTIAIDLNLSSERGPVMHGNNGLSQKSNLPGNASYYYSYTHMNTSGSIQTDAETQEVNGLSWFDREWSTSSLSETQAGWDWFALQLDTGEDLMIYRMRLKDGDIDSIGTGTFISQDGIQHQIDIKDIDLKPEATWLSESGAEYPVRWRLQLPAYWIDVGITARVKDQEVKQTFQYWEGAVLVEGSHKGHGYVELTGY